MEHVRDPVEAVAKNKQSWEDLKAALDTGWGIKRTLKLGWMLANTLIHSLPTLNTIAYPPSISI